MKTSIVLPALLLGTASLGFSVSAQAAWTDPVTGIVHGAGKVVTTVGKGGVMIVKGVGDGTARVLKGVGQGVGHVATGVGKGTAKVVKTTTKVVTGN